MAWLLIPREGNTICCDLPLKRPVLFLREQSVIFVLGQPKLSILMSVAVSAASVKDTCIRSMIVFVQSSGLDHLDQIFPWIISCCLEL